MKKTFYANPDAIILLSFFGAILIGTAVLMLPAASIGRPLGFIDAFFMSTSAVCVTGLAVVDVGTQLTRFGQLALMVLFQVGGLGIMTFSLFFFLFFKVKTSLATRLSVGGLSRKTDVPSLFHALFFVFLMTMSFEAIGAGVLFLRLREVHTFEYAVFSSVFHAISAFCNAGFSLYSYSLMDFKRETLLPVTMMSLIVFGGLGFIVIDEVREWLVCTIRRRRFRFSLHTRIALAGSALLIFAGAGLIWLFERNNLLEGLSAGQQIVNAFFHSITARTAGFNTLDVGAFTNATLFWTIMLMFIGGCPGSTAGGIKVHSFVTLIALLRSNIKGWSMTAIFNRKLPSVLVAKALSVFAAAFILINMATLMLQVTEQSGISHSLSKGSFLNLLFEATSAFGTVGLSTGVTPTLSAAGKLLVTLLMFVGRVGPLTMGILIVMRRIKTEAQFEYVEEEIMLN